MEKLPRLLIIVELNIIHFCACDVLRHVVQGQASQDASGFLLQQETCPLSLWSMLYP